MDSDRENRRLNQTDMTHFDDVEARLTAYALGEIDDAQVISEIESHLAGDAQARQLVDEVRVTAAILTNELHAEETRADEAAQPLLSSVERQSLVNAALTGSMSGGTPGTNAGPYPFPPLTQSKWFRLSAALAAVAAIGTFVTVISSPAFRPNYAPMDDDRFAMFEKAPSSSSSTARGRRGNSDVTRGIVGRASGSAESEEDASEAMDIEFYWQGSPGQFERALTPSETTLQHSNEGSVRDRIAVLRSEAPEPDQSADAFVGLMEAPQEEAGPTGGEAVSEEYKLRYRNLITEGEVNGEDKGEDVFGFEGRAGGKGGGEFAGEGFGLMERAPVDKPTATVSAGSSETEEAPVSSPPASVIEYPEDWPDITLRRGDPNLLPSDLFVEPDADSDERTQRQYFSLFDLVGDLEDAPQATDELAEIIASDQPDNRLEASEMRERAKEIDAARVAQMRQLQIERREKIIEGVTQIRQAQQEGDYDAALGLTEQMRATDPDNSVLQALHDVLEDQKKYGESSVERHLQDADRDHLAIQDEMVALKSQFPPGDAPPDLDQLVRARQRQIVNEGYARIYDNEFKAASEEPLSTFSIDVDTAAYANVRRFLKNMGTLPPADAVRIEEMLNSFDYAYEPPTKEAEHPFAVHSEIADCPWNPEHRLVKIGLKGYEVPADDRPASNLVFLIDSSGSMDDQNKLPLVQRSLTEMIDNLTVDDRIAIVTYAGTSRLVLDSTPVFEREKIVAAVNSLNAGGSTNGEGGIVQAYDVATEHFINGGTNRVILCTDGDFNVGVSDNSGLLRLIEEKRETGVFLSVLGFGMGNYKDNKLETLANKGNGNYAYIDNYDEAKKVLVDRMAGTLVTIAKDVKIQVDFNPTAVSSYRLIGYENRVMAARDFNDDTKDAGEIGAGHTVTALYEVVPAEGGELVTPDDIDESVYMETKPSEHAETSGELMTIRLRYKQPDENESTLWTVPVVDPGVGLGETSEDFRFAAAVASFGMALRQSPYAGEMDYQRLLDLAVGARGEDDQPDRADRDELISLIKEAHRIAPSIFEPRLAVVEGDEQEQEQEEDGTGDDVR